MILLTFNLYHFKLTFTIVDVSQPLYLSMGKNDVLLTLNVRVNELASHKMAYEPVVEINLLRRDTGPL